MKSRKELYAFALALIVTLALCFALAPTLIFAKSDYTYTVRVLAGNHGSFGGESEKVLVVGDNYAYGDTVVLNPSMVTPDGSKYYPRGFRYSGADAVLASDSSGNTTITVTKDTDLVVAYGVEGDLVSVTVSFVEYGTGRQLTNDAGQTSVTYRGKAGERFMVPFEYVSGYRPRYRNIVGTLGDEGTNNWTLEYIAIETPTVTETVTETTTTTGTGTTGATGTTGTTGTTEATPGATATGEGTTGTEGQAQTTTPETTTTEVVAAPPTEEILDLDTPLAGPDSQTQGQGDQDPSNANKKKDKQNVFNSVAVKLIIAVVALALALAAFFALRRPKTNDNDEKGSLG